MWVEVDDPRQSPLALVASAGLIGSVAVVVVVAPVAVVGEAPVALLASIADCSLPHPPAAAVSAAATVAALPVG